MFHICFWFFGFLLLHSIPQSPPKIHPNHALSLIIIRNIFPNIHPYHTHHCVYAISTSCHIKTFHISTEKNKRVEEDVERDFFLIFSKFIWERMKFSICQIVYDNCCGHEVPQRYLFTQFYFLQWFFLSFLYFIFVFILVNLLEELKQKKRKIISWMDR
jgi:hypothetical protein